MKHCKHCGNNIPGRFDTCLSTGYGDDCTKPPHNFPENGYLNDHTTPEASGFDCACGGVGIDKVHTQLCNRVTGDTEVIGSDCLCVLGSKKHNPECEYHTPDTEKCCENGSFKEPHECLKCLPDTEDELEDLWLGYSFLHTPDNLPQSKELFKDFTQILTSRDTYWKERVRKEVEGMRKEHIPADNVWEGDEEQEVGEWKFVPKEDGMYCLNCKRFTPEEGCICGLISFEALDTLLDNLK